MTAAEQPNVPGTKLDKSQEAPVRSDDPARELRHEVYGTKSQQDINNRTEFRDIIKHLKEADRFMDQLGGADDATVRAAIVKHYEAAHKLAGQIDQEAVTKREGELKKIFQDNKDLKPEEKKAIARELAVLDNMHRAVSFTRSNEGMALLRLGYDQQGQAFVEEARANDKDLQKPEPRDAWEAKFAQEHISHFFADLKDAIADNKLWHQQHPGAAPPPLEITQASAPTERSIAKPAPSAVNPADAINQAEAEALAKAHEQAVKNESADDAAIHQKFEAMRKAQGLPTTGSSETLTPAVAPDAAAAQKKMDEVMSGLSDAQRSDVAALLQKYHLPSAAAEALSSRVDSQKPLDESIKAELKALIKAADTVPVMSDSDVTKVTGALNSLSTVEKNALAGLQSSLAPNDAKIKALLDQSQVPAGTAEQPGQREELLRVLTSVLPYSAEERQKIVAVQAQAIFPGADQEQQRKDLVAAIEERYQIIPQNLVETAAKIENGQEMLTVTDQGALTRLTLAVLTRATGGSAQDVHDQMLDAWVHAHTPISLPTITTLAGQAGVTKEQFEAAKAEYAKQFAAPQEVTTPAPVAPAAPPAGTLETGAVRQDAPAPVAALAGEVKERAAKVDATQAVSASPFEAATAIQYDIEGGKRAYDDKTKAQLQELIKAADAAPAASDDQIKAVTKELTELDAAAAKLLEPVKSNLDANKTAIGGLLEKSALAAGTQGQPGDRERKFALLTDLPPLSPEQLKPIIASAFPDAKDAQALTDLLDARAKLLPAEYSAKQSEINQKLETLAKSDQPALTRSAAAMAFLSSIDPNASPEQQNQAMKLLGPQVLDAAIKMRTLVGFNALAPLLSELNIGSDAVVEAKAAVDGLAEPSRLEVLSLLSRQTPSQAALELSDKVRGGRKYDAATAEELAALIKAADAAPRAMSDADLKALTAKSNALMTEIETALKPIKKEIDEKTAAIKASLADSDFKSSPADVNAALALLTRNQPLSAKAQTKILAVAFPNDEAKRTALAKLIDDRSKLIPDDLKAKQKDVAKLINTMESADQPALTRLYAAEVLANSIDKAAPADARNAILKQVEDQFAEAATKVRTDLGIQELGQSVKQFGFDRAEFQKAVEEKMKAAKAAPVPSAVTPDAGKEAQKPAAPVPSAVTPDAGKEAQKPAAPAPAAVTPDAGKEAQKPAAPAPAAVTPDAGKEVQKPAAPAPAAVTPDAGKEAQKPAALAPEGASTEGAKLASDASKKAGVLDIDQLRDVMIQAGKVLQSLQKAQSTVTGPDSFTADTEKALKDGISALVDVQGKLAANQSKDLADRQAMYDSWTPEQRAAWQKVRSAVVSETNQLDEAFNRLGMEFANNFLDVLAVNSYQAGAYGDQYLEGQMKQDYDAARARLAKGGVDPEKFHAENAKYFALWTKRAEQINSAIPVTDDLLKALLPLEQRIGHYDFVQASKLDAMVDYARDLLTFKGDHDAAKQVAESVVKEATDVQRKKVMGVAWLHNLIAPPEAVVPLKPLLPSGNDTVDKLAKNSSFEQLQDMVLANRDRTNQAIRKIEDELKIREKQKLPPEVFAKIKQTASEQEEKIFAQKFTDMKNIAEATVRKASEIDLDQVKLKVQKLQSELESGKTADPETKVERDLTPEEKLAHHQKITMLLEASEQPLFAQYGMTSYYIGVASDKGTRHPEEAGQAYQAAAKEVAGFMSKIDALPIDLMNKEDQLLLRDMSDPALSNLSVSVNSTQQATLADMRKSFDALRQEPIGKALEAADFMISGGRNKDGTPVGFANTLTFDKYLDDYQKTMHVSAETMNDPDFMKKRETAYIDLKNSFSVLDASTAWTYRDKAVALNKIINGGDLASLNNPQALARSVQALDHLIAQSAPEDVRKKLGELAKTADSASPNDLKKSLADIASSTSDRKVKEQVLQLAEKIEDSQSRAKDLSELEGRIKENYPEQLRRELASARATGANEATEIAVVAAGLAGAGLVGRFGPLSKLGLAAERLAPLRTLGLPETQAVGPIGTRLAQLAVGNAAAFGTDMLIQRELIGRDESDFNASDALTQSSVMFNAAALAVWGSRSFYNAYKGAGIPVDKLSSLASERVANVLGGTAGEHGIVGLKADAVTAKHTLSLVEGNAEARFAAELLMKEPGFANKSLLMISRELNEQRAARVEELTKGSAMLAKGATDYEVSETAEGKAVAKLLESGANKESTPAQLSKLFSGLKVQAPELRRVAELLPTTPLSEVPKLMDRLAPLEGQAGTGTLQETIVAVVAQKARSEAVAGELKNFGATTHEVEGKVESIAEQPVGAVRELFNAMGESEKEHVALIDKALAGVAPEVAANMKFGELVDTRLPQVIAAADKQIEALRELGANADLAGKTLDQARAAVAQANENLPNAFGVSRRPQMALMHELDRLAPQAPSKFLQRFGQFSSQAFRPLAPLSPHATPSEVLGSMAPYGAVGYSLWFAGDQFVQARYNIDHNGKSESVLSQIASNIKTQAGDSPSSLGWFGVQQGLNFMWGGALLFNRPLSIEMKAGMSIAEGGILRRGGTHFMNAINPGEVRTFGHDFAQKAFWPVTLSVPMAGFNYYASGSARAPWQRALDNQKATRMSSYSFDSPPTPKEERPQAAVPNPEPVVKSKAAAPSPENVETPKAAAPSPETVATPKAAAPAPAKVETPRKETPKPAASPAPAAPPAEPPAEEKSPLG